MADADADADAGEEGSRRDSSGVATGIGKQETASAADAHAEGSKEAAAAAAAAGGDDALLLPDGPSLFGERPIDRCVRCGGRCGVI